VKSAHAAHGLGGETQLASKPPHTLTRKEVVSSLDFQVNAHAVKTETQRNMKMPTVQVGYGRRGDACVALLLAQM